MRLFAIMFSLTSLKGHLQKGNLRALARALTLVENDIAPAQELLKSLCINHDIPVIGVTGPPGAGKSTLVSAIVQKLTEEGKKTAVLAVDPTSPFNHGSLLGDRIRMSKHFNNSNVYIRSIATRGSLGGISAKTIEMVDVLKSSPFDLIIIETVGVGQSEIEIAGLADKTILILVPESGDEIQHIKSGLMEVAQAFVVNKADRDGADTFAMQLEKTIKAQQPHPPIFKTIANKNIGVAELSKWLLKQNTITESPKKMALLLNKAFKLIQNRRMASIDREQLSLSLQKASAKNNFNLYSFIELWV